MAYIVQGMLKGKQSTDGLSFFEFFFSNIQYIQFIVINSYKYDPVDSMQSHELILYSYLSQSFGFVVVIMAGQVDIFMNTIQQPQKELQGVMLGISTKL